MPGRAGTIMCIPTTAQGMSYSGSRLFRAGTEVMASVPVQTGQTNITCKAHQAQLRTDEAVVPVYSGNMPVPASHVRLCTCRKAGRRIFHIAFRRSNLYPIKIPSGPSDFGPFYRTYTGHEDLWMFGLLNANARLYSPYLGRFVSPDPLLNEDGGLLDFNPYVYARNNPYRYIDRNGEFAWFIPVIAALVGGVINVATNLKLI